jgi:sulfate transport system permease protein
VSVRLAERQPPARSRRRLARGGLTGMALLYIGVLVLAPLIGITVAALKPGLSGWASTLSDHDAIHAFMLTGLITLETVVITAVLGVVVALVLARDRFIGRGVVSAVVNLPLAVSPVVVGLAAVLLFGRTGWFGPWFASRGIQIVFALPSMVLVTIFICIPFVIREVVPVLEELGTVEEDAARTLGASPVQTFFRVTLPNIRWGLLYGIALSTARSIGEIGAVLIVSGAIQGKTETATLYVLRAFEERQDASGYFVALTLAVISILVLTAIELLKRNRAKQVASP